MITGRRCRFVQPDVVRLEVSDGDWLDVKKRLTVGEERAAFQQIVGEVNIDGSWRKPNFEMIGLAEVAAYIVAWSFVDPQGRAVPFSLQALQNLEPASYREIEAAIDAHVKRVEAARSAEKNASDGEIAPGTILPSVA